MSLGKRNTTMPDAARRRASTNRKTDGIMRLGPRACQVICVWGVFYK